MLKKISLIIFGILLIALFELSLYFTGKIFLYARGSNQSLDNTKFNKLICCIGDSHTFGVGVSHKYSYPRQLEILLNLNNPQTPFKVVNLGVPGNSTLTQMERLEAFLSKNKADLVILLTGRNNYYEVETWENKSFLANVITKIKKFRTYKLLQYVLSRFLRVDNMEDINSPIEMAKYENYIVCQLSKAKTLCEKHRCRLLLISYYNSHDEYIEKIAKQLGILYFNLCQDFSETVPQKDMFNFISRDSSHMNSLGYKIFAELLYKQMFLHNTELNLKINPLIKKMDEDNFHKDIPTSYLIYLQGKSVFYKN
jgi:lysophospholipase L1-like esterase